MRVGKKELRAFQPATRIRQNEMRKTNSLGCASCVDEKFGIFLDTNLASVKHA